MLGSMTGFAAKQVQIETGLLSIELKSVNHRYLDLSFRLADVLRDQEMAYRDLIKQTLQRGRVDVTLKFEAASQATGLNVNESMLESVTTAIQTINAAMGGVQATDPMRVLAWPGMVSGQELDVEAVQTEARTLLEAALLELQQQRHREGDALKAILLEKIDSVATTVVAVKQRLPEVIQKQRQQLQQRVDELQAKVDAERLEQEMVVLVQRSDVAEELDRLMTHVNEVKRVLNDGGVVGRRLDFLMQELNREANTLASKSIDSLVTQHAVELKVLIEQMREQIQNIE